MKRGKIDVWIDSSGYVRIRQEYGKNHWQIAVLKPILVRETTETKEFANEL